MAALQETVAVPDPVMVVALMLPQVSPLGGLSVNVTAAVNPLRAVIVIVVVADWATRTAAGVEAATVKSGWIIVNVAIVEWIREPLVPVIVSL